MTSAAPRRTAAGAPHPTSQPAIPISHNGMGVVSADGDSFRVCKIYVPCALCCVLKDTRGPDMRILIKWRVTLITLAFVLCPLRLATAANVAIVKDHWGEQIIDIIGKIQKGDALKNQAILA